MKYLHPKLDLYEPAKFGQSDHSFANLTKIEIQIEKHTTIGNWSDSKPSDELSLN